MTQTVFRTLTSSTADAMPTADHTTIPDALESVIHPGVVWVPKRGASDAYPDPPDVYRVKKPVGTVDDPLNLRTASRRPSNVPEFDCYGLPNSYGLPL